MQMNQLVDFKLLFTSKPLLTHVALERFDFEMNIVGMMPERGETREGLSTDGAYEASAGNLEANTKKKCDER